MTTMKERLARWSRLDTQPKEDSSMTTDQLEYDPLDEQDAAGHAGVEAGTEAQAVAQTSTQPGELEKLRSERDQLALQMLQAQDRLARLQAEFDNSRKREVKERQDARERAIQSAIEPFLGVMDNFALALKADGDVTQLRAGIDLIVKQMEEALRTLQVQTVPTVGEQFDPRIHEALGSIETVEHPDHQVLEEIRRGYRLRDKLLRPALVRIASNSAQTSD
jgi:molecular chaperone GrpE